MRPAGEGHPPSTSALQDGPPPWPDGGPQQAPEAVVSQLIHQGRLTEANVLFDRLLAGVPLDNEGWRRSAALARLAAFAWHLHRIPLALELAAEVLAALEMGYPDGPTTAEGLRLLAYLLDSIGERENALQIDRRAVSVARRANDPALLGQCLQNLAGTLNFLALDGSPASARPAFEEARALLEEGLALPCGKQVRVGLYGAYAVTLAGLGELIVAERMAVTTQRLAVEVDSRWGEAVGAWVLAKIRMARGELLPARELATFAVVAAKQHNHIPLVLRLSVDLADVCAAIGDKPGEAAALRYTLTATRTESAAMRKGLAQALEQRRVAIRAQQAAAAASADAERDPLTGLANRRGLERTAALLFEQAAATATTVSLIIVDIDRFKSINDEAGHIVGDQVLSEVAQLLRAECRTGDLVARWGGEEFVILIVERRDQPAGPVLAERMRQAVLTHNWTAGIGDLPPPTISAGVAAASPTSLGGPSLQDLFSAADAALYRAKRAGRNQVEVARLYRDGGDLP